MAERFRDLVRPALVDTQARSTPSGASEASQAIAASLREFSRAATTLGGDFATRIGAKEGAEEGAAAGAEGEFDPRRGFAGLSAYGQAYNDAALRSYAIRAETDLEDTAARLETEAAASPDAFREAMEEVRSGVMEEAPPEARGVLTDIYNRRIAQGVSRLSAEEAGQLREEDRTLVSEQIARLTERVSVLRAQDTPEAHEESQREETKLFMLLDAAVEDGTLSEVEGRTATRKARRGIVAETVRERFVNEMDSPYGDPIGFIEDLKEMNRTADVLPPDEEAELENSLLAELRERNSLRSARASQMQAEAEARHEAGDRQATAEMLAGELTQRDLLEKVQNDEITPGTARTLLNELQQGDTAPKSDPQELFTVETNLLSYTDEEIATNQGLTWSDRSRLIQKRRDEAEGWKGTQVAKEAFNRIDRSLGILPGTHPELLTEEELRARDEALTQLYDRVDALPPEERQSAILNETQQVIRDTIRSQAASELDTARQTLSEARALREEATSERDQRVLDRSIDQLEQRIRELEVLRGQQ